MKIHSTLFGLCITAVFLMTAYSVHAQTTGVTSQEIISYMSKGDVSSISKHFQSNVEVSILDTNEASTSREGIVILESFFKKYPPRDFKLKHDMADPKSSSKSAKIGTLSTANGNYRVMIYVDKGKICKMDITVPFSN